MVSGGGGWGMRDWIGWPRVGNQRGKKSNVTNEMLSNANANAVRHSKYEQRTTNKIEWNQMIGARVGLSAIGSIASSPQRFRRKCVEREEGSITSRYS